MAPRWPGQPWVVCPAGVQLWSQAQGEGFLRGGTLPLKGAGTQVGRPGPRRTQAPPECHRGLLPSSPQDSRLYLVFPHDSSALSSSFHQLQLFDQDSSNVVSVSPRASGGGGGAWRGGAGSAVGGAWRGGAGGGAGCDAPGPVPSASSRTPTPPPSAASPE